MRWYPDRIPDWFSNLFTAYVWHGDREVKTVYLTFDDGPTPQITDLVLGQLERFNFKASFFLIGDCVSRHSEYLEKIKSNGHSIGNHTYDHLNSWKTSKENYLESVSKAAILIDSKLFRPPYGRITTSVAQKLKSQGYQIILWDVLSGDFDSKRTPSSCLKSLKKSTKNGSIIVFHDSIKAYSLLEKVLPDYLQWLKDQGFKSEAL